MCFRFVLNVLGAYGTLGWYFFVEKLFLESYEMLLYERHPVLCGMLPDRSLREGIPFSMPLLELLMLMWL